MKHILVILALLAQPAWLAAQAPASARLSPAVAVAAKAGRPVDVLTVASPSPGLGDEIVTVHLTILDHDDLRGGLKPDAGGRTQRGDLAALRRLMSAPSGGEAAP